jgi:twinkle protein
MQNDSTIVEQHIPCTIDGGCGSSDGMCVYDDGHEFCFACEGVNTKVTTKPPGSPGTKSSDYRPNLPLSFQLPLKTRGITTDTMRKFDYGQGKDHRGNWCHITNLRDSEGTIVGQKLRDREKNFTVLGSAPAVFWGQHLFDKGRKLVITEGEIDAMSVSQVFDNKYPVVSLPNGAQSVKKTFGANLSWLDRFDEVVLCFDQDEPGQAAALKAAKLLPPGKAKIAKLPLNDSNLLVQKGMFEELKRAVYDAKLWRPETIKSGADITAEIMRKLPGNALAYEHRGLHNLLRGLRPGEITLVGAGTGVGKTTFIKELIHTVIKQGDKVGTIMLEEDVKTTGQGLITTFVDFPVHIKMLDGPDGLTKTEVKQVLAASKKWIEPNVEMFDDSLISPEDLLRHIRYMSQSLGCKTIVLDHITMLANLAPSGEERTLLDNTMNRIAALVKELQPRFLLASHVKRPQGRTHEEGAPVRLGDFRGSTQIAALSHNVIGVERNQQHPTNRDYTRLRVLKCRVTGFTGIAGWMYYDTQTGRMIECEEPDGGLDAPAGAGHADAGEDY